MKEVGGRQDKACISHELSLIYFRIADNTDPRNLRRLSKSERAEGLKGLSETKPILTLDGVEI